MNSTFWSRVMIGVTGVVAGGVMLPAGAQAQAITNAPIAAGLNQSVVGAAVGNGVTQGKTVANVGGGDRPLVGVGALSAKSDHYGSAASVSVLNSERLLAVDGPGGPSSTTSVSVPNSTRQPVLAPR